MKFFLAIMKIFQAIALVLLWVALNVGITCLLVWVVCWAFGLTWSLKLAIGVWAALSLIAMAVKSTRGKER